MQTFAQDLVTILVSKTGLVTNLVTNVVSKNALVTNILLFGYQKAKSKFGDHFGHQVRAFC